MDTRRSRRMLFAAALLALALTGATGIAVAQSSNGPNNPRADELDGADPGKPSSVTVREDPAGTEANEATTLQGLAKITPDQAKAAAIAAVPGNATKVELENEDGNVVYAVEVAGTDGRQTDLKIDAGNGAVLSKETETEAAADETGDATGDGHEKVETNEQHQADEAGEAPETAGD